jgi:hypothetical protein
MLFDLVGARKGDLWRKAGARQISMQRSILGEFAFKVSACLSVGIADSENPKTVDVRDIRVVQFSPARIV